MNVSLEQLSEAAQVAWRNADRCIGRLYWRSLIVRDRRHLLQSGEIFQSLVEHLVEATNSGRVRAIATLLDPSVHISNEQLIGYAGYQLADGSVLGDPRHLQITQQALAMGWLGGRVLPSGHRAARGRFDLLPLLISVDGGPVALYELPPEVVCEVEISHPEHAWFAELGLRWYAIPAITDMRLWLSPTVGYPAAFGGWWLATGIACRELADTDRYDSLPAIAHRLGLDTTTTRTLWLDRAEHELMRAVLHSFDRAGVRVTDHHAESARFLTFVANEKLAGRVVRSDWSWIVPTQASARLGVYHTYQEPPDPTVTPVFSRIPPPPAADRIEETEVADARTGDKCQHRSGYDDRDPGGAATSEAAAYRR